MTFGRHWIRHWIAVAAVVPLVVLGACSQEDPQPKFSPPSDSPSASESTPADPVVRPWEKKTEAGAVAFAKHWMDVFSAAMLSGEVDELLALSGPNCEACKNVAHRLVAVYSTGGMYETEGWRVLESDAAVSRSGSASVGLRIRRSAETFRENAGGPKQSNPTSEASYNAILSWRDGAWRMERLDLVA